MTTTPEQAQQSTASTASFWDPAAEAAVLGAALCNESAAAYAVRHLSAADFYLPGNQQIFATIAAMAAAGEAIDVITVGAKLPQRRDELHALQDACVTATNVADYVALVKEMRIRRDLLAATRQGLHLIETSNGDAARLRREWGALMRGVLDAAASAGRQSPFIDWPSFWERDHSEAEWVYPDVLARGRGHAIYANHKAGKSLLMLWIAARLATSKEPIVVCYLDYEMTEADVYDRLDDMGYGPQSDLSRLRYALLPSLPPLDTAEGASELTVILDEIKGRWPDHHQVVVVDTISRAVSGEENSADTWRDWYVHTGMELKRRHATWVRLDHGGKDPTRGQRGSSGKGDDVDLVWKLVQTDNGVCLHRDLARMSWVPEKVSFMLAEEPLRYVRIADEWPAGTGETANLLDRLGVALDASTREAQKRLRDIGEGRRRHLVTAALRWRRQRMENNFDIVESGSRNHREPPGTTLGRVRP